jgi:hypothetical protein
MARSTDFKTYKVSFSRTAVGETAAPLHQSLRDAFTQHGLHLPVLELSGEKFQMRDLQRVGAVWKGSFAKLRDDAPHVVAVNQQERELSLDEGDHIIEKCYFLLREHENLLVWQLNRAAGGLSRAEEYLSRLFSTMVILPPVINTSRLEQVMAGQLYELDFAYDRPPQLAANAPQWNKNAFDMMANVDAAHAKFNLRAPRSGHLAETVKTMMRQLASGTVGVKKIKVRLTDETDLIELIMAPLRDTIRVELLGRYPAPGRVFEELEAAYDRQHDSIPPLPTP